jgi:hypothetical protein
MGVFEDTSKAMGDRRRERCAGRRIGVLTGS